MFTQPVYIIYSLPTIDLEEASMTWANDSMIWLNK